MVPTVHFGRATSVLPDNVFEIGVYDLNNGIRFWQTKAKQISIRYVLEEKK